MSHEPECDDYQGGNSDGWCICTHVLDAYHRGRNDTARAIVAEIDSHKPDAIQNNYQEGLLDGLDIALGAARGGNDE